MSAKFYKKFYFTEILIWAPRNSLRKFQVWIFYYCRIVTIHNWWSVRTRIFAQGRIIVIGFSFSPMLYSLQRIHMLKLLKQIRNSPVEPHRRDICNQIDATFLNIPVCWILEVYNKGFDRRWCGNVVFPMEVSAFPGLSKLENLIRMTSNHSFMHNPSERLFCFLMWNAFLTWRPA